MIEIRMRADRALLGNFVDLSRYPWMYIKSQQYELDTKLPR